MEFYAFKLNLAQLGGFVLSLVSAWIMLRKESQKHRRKRKRKEPRLKSDHLIADAALHDVDPDAPADQFEHQVAADREKLGIEPRGDRPAARPSLLRRVMGSQIFWFTMALAGVVVAVAASSHE